MRQMFTTALLVLFCNITLLAQQEAISVTATGTQVISGMSPEAAYDLALENALTKAKQFLGIEVYSYSMLAQAEFESNERSKSEYNEIFAKYTKTQTTGKILSYQILDEKKIQEGYSNFHTWEITVSTEIVKDTTESKFNFVAKFDQEKRHYNDGDKISLIVKSANDCYLYIFHIYDLPNAVVWLPDEKWFQPNLLKANTTRVIPADNEVPITISISEGRDMEINHLLIVGITEDVGFVDMERPDHQSYYETDLFRINKWLISLGKQIEKVELYMPFVIHSKNDTRFQKY